MGIFQDLLFMYVFIYLFKNKRDRFPTALIHSPDVPNNGCRGSQAQKLGAQFRDLTPEPSPGASWGAF